MATTHDPLTGATDRPDSSSASSLNSMKEKLTDVASNLKNTASDYGRSAVNQIDRNVHNAAGALQSTAQSLRSQAGAAEGRVSGVAQTAAEKLDRTAQYLQNYDTRQALTQLESWTRRNPGMALGGALAIGFVIGLSLRRDTETRYY